MFLYTAGSILGRYELLLPLAQGGMAEVWAARLHGTRGFTKLVAIKMIRKGAMDDTQLEQMFLDEAQIASQIQHPNVISTLELGEQDGTLFLVMEWADAEPLSYLLKETAESGGIPVPIGVNIIAQACRGLHRAHELSDHDGNLLGVVHRDISPQNVLVTYLGTAKLVDFGIAKATQRSSSMTEDGQVRGKLAYMSPEQARGEPLDRRTDIFAMGTLLYVLTTGQHPFKGSHPGETLANLISPTPVLPPWRHNPSYPQALVPVVVKALHKNKDLRFGTAEEMLDALEQAMPETKGSDGEVARFLARTCAARGDARRRHIRTAGEVLDRNAEELGAASQNPSSLSAVYLGRSATHTNTLPSSQQNPTQHAVPVIEFSPKRSKRGMFAGAALLAGGALLGILITQGSDIPAGGAAAASPRPFDASLDESGRADPSPPSSAAVKSSAALAADAGSSSDEAALAERTDKGLAGESTPARAGKRPVKPTVRQVVTPGSRGASQASPKTAVSAKTEKPAAPPPPAQAPKVDSWDPDVFGGRL